MTDYDTFERSIEDGTPTEIYEITVRSEITQTDIDQFFYTSAPVPVTIASQVYTPVEGLKSSNSSEGLSKRDLDYQITLPTSNDVAQIFTGRLPGFRVRLKVSRFHLADTPTPEVILVFDGFIQSVSFGSRSKIATLTARPVLASLGRIVPRRTYQSSCNHVLYDQLTCRVDKTLDAFHVDDVRVASISGVAMTLIGLDQDFIDGFATAGFVELINGTDQRTIRNHSGNVLTLINPFKDDPTSVNVFAGCDHLFTTCVTKFDNGEFFGGFPYVPTRNPYVSDLE